MKREIISEAMNGLDSRHISETLFFEPEAMQAAMERMDRMNRIYSKRRTKRFVTILVAACLIMSLGVAAYASDYFGLRALLIRNEDFAPNPFEEGGYVSVTQPQEVPEEMSADVKAKIENSTKAWEEWNHWRKENGIYQPEVFVAPEGCSTAEHVENEDGTYTIIFYKSIFTFGDDGRPVNVEYEEMERRIATAEEYEQEMIWAETMAKGYDGYDFNYHVYSKEMADKLEEIAADYGLNLRHKNTIMYENFGPYTESYAFKEVIDRINEICAGGKNFFRTEPTGFDKFYYFDEGTFAVSFFTTEDKTNMGTSCYLYNSPYSTLSSGFEILGLVKDVNAMSSYTHSTPDGTEVTVLHNGADMYAYVYLENSFVTLTFHQTDGLSTDEMNEIIDMIDFSTIK